MINNSQAIDIALADMENLHDLMTVSADTFYETFAGDNSKEDMDAYLAHNFNADQLGKEIKDPGNNFFLARIGGKVVGYAKLRKSETPPELKGQTSIELERIYVLKLYHAQKVGAALMQHCVVEARSLQVDTLWLGVWEHNHRALNFYKKWGFTVFGSHGFQLGADLQTDLLMALRLP